MSSWEDASFSSGKSTARKDDAVDKARKEREERALLKKKNESAVRIQALVKGALSRSRLLKELEKDLAAKLADIHKLDQVLKATKKVPFVPPANATIRLTRCAYFIIRLKRLTQNKTFTSQIDKRLLILISAINKIAAQNVFNGSLTTIWSPECRLRLEALILIEMNTKEFPAPRLSSSFLGSSEAQLRHWFNEVFVNGKHSRRLQERLEAYKDCDQISEALLKGGPPSRMLIFSSNGFLSNIHSSAVFDKALEVLDEFLKELAPKLSTLQSGATHAIFGNLVVLAVRVPKGQRHVFLSERFIGILSEMVRIMPINTFAGAEGVSWNNETQKVEIVRPVVLQQLDSFSVLAEMLMRDALRIYTTLEGQGSVNESTVKTPRPQQQDQLPRRQSSRPSGLFSLMASSTWAKKLGWSSSKATKISQTDEEEEDSPLLGQHSQTAAQKDPTPLVRLCALLATFWTRWPPSYSNPRSLSTLNCVAFCSLTISERLWRFAESMWDLNNTSCRMVLMVFAIVCFHCFLITDETEIHEKQRPMSKTVLERVIRKLNQALFTSTNLDNPNEKALQTRIVRLLSLVRDFHVRHELAPESSWLLSESDARPSGYALSSMFRSVTDALGGFQSSERSLSSDELGLLNRRVFWAIPFHRRAEWFRRTLREARLQPSNQDRPIRLEVRRNNLLDDRVIDVFLKSDLKRRLYVIYVNDFGLPEAGIDSRGLTKEFLQLVVEQIFDVRRGLFAASDQGDGCLYPNPRYFGASRDRLDRLYNFAGRVMGKAMFEGIIIQPELSLFILAKLLNKLVTVAELQSLDKELYRNLLFLKNTDMDVSQLELVFAIDSLVDHPSKTVDLIPNGSRVAVTNENRFRYVNLVAHYRLNVENKHAQDAFVSGFRSVINFEWTEPFAEPEIQRLISGDAKTLDVKDWRSNTVYATGYSSMSHTIQLFWELVESDMTESDRTALLRFVTACTRAPLMGFGLLEPKFTIQRVSSDQMQLPSASTCFNTLKLPAYTSKAILKQKLFQAIHSNAGFDLT